MSTYTSTPLFGGAIFADLPSTFADASQIRQVPDNQEVYLDKHGLTSIIFDITERVGRDVAATDEDALKYHFQDIVSGGGGAQEETKFWPAGFEEPKLGKMSTTPIYALFATQHRLAPQPTAPRRPTADFTGIMLILVRLETQKTDIVITVNVPHVPGEYETADIDLVSRKAGPLLENAREAAEKLMASFEVKDWSLFGED